MNETDFLDIQNKCRICLVEGQFMNSFFDPYLDDCSLVDILKTVSNIEEVINDGKMPKCICNYCTTTILNFKSLLKIFHESEEYVRGIICKNEFKNTRIDENVSINAKKIADLDDKSSADSNNEDDYDCKDDVDNEDDIFYELPSSSKDKTNIQLLESENTDNKLNFKTENTNDNSEFEDIFTTKYSCEICGDCFLFKSGFSHHMLMAHRVCIQVNQYEQYSSDIKIKIPKAVAECDMKPRKVSSQSIGKLNDFSCKKCKEEFESAEELKKHCEIHKTFRCEQCGAAFIKNSYLRDHLLKHSTDKCYSCKICGQAFKYRSALAVHRRDHTGTNRGHMCETCGKSFKERGTLKTHIMLKHTNERNFPCTGCGLTFKLKAARDKHFLRKHTNNRTKDFVCSRCGMAYLNKETLTRHMNDKHTEVPVVHWCTVCEKSFTMKSNLFKHLRNKHNVITRSD